MKFNPNTGKLVDYDDELDAPVEESVAEPEEPLDRKTLLKTLADAEKEVKPRTRTTTLKKMVDALDTEE